MDQLKSALIGALGPSALPTPTAPTPLAVAQASLPNPIGSEWIKLLRASGGEVPAQPTLGQLVQRSDLRARELANAGRRREAEALKSARERFVREREKAAWALVKARFEALELSDRTYRSIKQEDVEPEKLFGALFGRSSADLRGAGLARVRELLVQK